MLRVFLQLTLEMVADQKFSPFSHDSTGRLKMEKDIHQCHIRTRFHECDPTCVFQVIERTPSHLAIFDPILIYCIPFVATCYLHHPMAAFIVIIGHFLDETHGLGKIIEMGEKSIDLVYRCLDRDRYKSLSHQCVHLSSTDLSRESTSRHPSFVYRSSSRRSLCKYATSAAVDLLIVFPFLFYMCPVQNDSSIYPVPMNISGSPQC